MGKYGSAQFQVFGKLVTKPQLVNKNGFESAKIMLEVTTRNSQNKTERTEIIPITAVKYDAQSISKYGVEGAFYCITGLIRSRDWTNQEGKSTLIMELQATKIMGGPDQRESNSNSNNRRR